MSPSNIPPTFACLRSVREYIVTHRLLRIWIADTYMRYKGRKRLMIYVRASKQSITRDSFLEAVWCDWIPRFIRIFEIWICRRNILVRGSMRAAIVIATICLMKPKLTIIIVINLTQRSNSIMYTSTNLEADISRDNESQLLPTSRVA